MLKNDIKILTELYPIELILICDESIIFIDPWEKHMGDTE